MSKRGQVTIFIIIAIILVVGVILFFVLKENLKLSVFNPEVERVKTFVEVCIEETGNEVIFEIGKNGGYSSPPELSTETEIPYYYLKGRMHIPPKEKVEEEISDYVDQKLSFCIKNFVDFPDLKIDAGEILTKTKIEDDRVILNVHYPLSITKAESTSIIENFEDIKIPIRIGVIYDSIDKIIKEQMKHEGICLSCILEVSLENDLYIDMMDYDEETVIFIVKDENSVINDISFEFKFANKY